MGIAILGTLGVLRDGAIAGLLDLPTVLGRLRQTSFRAAPALYDQMIREFEQIRRSSP